MLYQLGIWLMFGQLVAGQKSPSPGILEYSDYYYDLYYGGDYDDIPGSSSFGSSPTTVLTEPNQAPRSQTRHQRRRPNKESNNSSNRHSHVSQSERNISTEPLNVRLQRLIQQDESAARLILDILLTSETTHKEIVKFLRGVVRQNNDQSEQISFQPQVRNQSPPSNLNSVKQAAPTSSPSPTSKTPITSARPPPPPPPPPPTRPLPRRAPPSPELPSTRPASVFKPNLPTLPSNDRQDHQQNGRDRFQPLSVDQQFSQFPNFQSHLNDDSGNEKQQDSIKEVTKSGLSNQNFQQPAGHGVKLPDSDPNHNVRSFTQNNFAHSNSQEDRQPKRQEDENDKSHGLTIEEFLDRYPEVKRLSSRYNENGEDLAETTLPPPKQFKEKNHKKNKGKKNSSHNQEEISLTSPPPTLPPRKSEITPKQRTVSSISLAEKQSSQFNQPEQAKPEVTPAPPPQSLTTTALPAVNQDPVEYDYGFDYYYYYDQLVPEHERFFQLPKNKEENNDYDDGKQNNSGGTQPFQVFTHFNPENQAKQSKFPPPPASASPRNPKPRPSKPEKAASNRPPKNSKVPSSQNSLVKQRGSANMAGPFGYVEKGTFFIDDHTTSFPERIEMIYQGFVWAFHVSYTDQPTESHGGIHRILEDKVKRETIDLKNDHIVRVSGRASPYNINRLTFYTANGKQYGPWGDRHSEDSVDFDVRAPSGHALAFFSGTIDFGVPLRSIGLHWKPIQ